MSSVTLEELLAGIAARRRAGLTGVARGATLATLPGIDEHELEPIKGRRTKPRAKARRAPAKSAVITFDSECWTRKGTKDRRLLSRILIPGGARGDA